MPYIDIAFSEEMFLKKGRALRKIRINPTPSTAKVTMGEVTGLYKQIEGKNEINVPKGTSVYVEVLADGYKAVRGVVLANDTLFIPMLLNESDTWYAWCTYTEEEEEALPTGSTPPKWVFSQYKNGDQYLWVNEVTSLEYEFGTYNATTDTMQTSSDTYYRRTEEDFVSKYQSMVLYVAPDATTFELNIPLALPASYDSVTVDWGEEVTETDPETGNPVVNRVETVYSNNETSWSHTYDNADFRMVTISSEGGRLPCLASNAFDGINLDRICSAILPMTNSDGTPSDKSDVFVASSVSWIAPNALASLPQLLHSGISLRNCTQLMSTGHTLILGGVGRSSTSINVSLSGCSQIQTVELPDLAPFAAQSSINEGTLGDMLSGLSNVTVKLPSNLQEIGDSLDFGGTNITKEYTLPPSDDIPFYEGAPQIADEALET